MDEKTHVRPSLGSRLPKFGRAKSGESLLHSMANGSPIGVLANTNGNNGRGCIKQNGATPTSTSSGSYRKASRHSNDQNAVVSTNPPCNPAEKTFNNKKYLKQEGGVGKEVLKFGLKNTCSGASKADHPADIIASTTEVLNQKPSPGLSNSAKFTKGTFLGRTSYSASSVPKPQLNGYLANRPAVDLQRPRAHSMIVRSSSKEGFPQATDSINAPLGERIIRSQSFSHSLTNSMLPTATLTRSHSFNRAVDLTKPYQNQHATVRAFQRSNLLSRSARQSEIYSANEPHLKFNFQRTALPVSGLKKSNSSGLVTPLGYQMTRPSLLKPNRSQFASKMLVDPTRSSSVDSCILEKAEPSPNDEGATDEQKALMEKKRHSLDPMLDDSLETPDSKAQYLSDDVDEISISSLSSSDKNEFSEDFSDDFLDLDDPNTTVIKKAQTEATTAERTNISTVQEEQIKPEKDGRVSHSKAEEWISRSLSDFSIIESDYYMRILLPYKQRIKQSGDVEDGSMQESESSVEETTCEALHVASESLTANTKSENSNTYEAIPISPDMISRDGSSLELSPSDSSDGTYMWDEEGLEPIGTVHACGSYDSSEMNSIDVLNNLDSCDIEDDDLMLDVDLPEDTPSAGVDGENMNRFERPERNIRPPQQVLWKRSQQQRRSGQDHYRLSSNEHYLHSRELNRGTNYLDHTTGIVDGYGPTNLYQAQRIPQVMGLHDNIVMLDELTLRHMVQDCTSVKTQLLKLKRLLQIEDPASMHDSELSTPVTPEPHDAETTLKEEHFGEFDDDLRSPISETFSNDSSPTLPKVNKNQFIADDLLNEIRQLKAEAKIKDERIKQLEHQLATRCNCGKEPQQIQQSSVTLRSHCDKFTQTPWRKVSPQVLQHPINIPSTTDRFQGTLAKPSPSEDLNEDHSEPYTEALEKEASELSDLLSTQIKIEDLDNDGPSEEFLHSNNTFAVSRPEAWSEVEQPQMCSSIVEELQIEPQNKSSLKKPSITPKSRPKTLPLFIPRNESPMSPQEEASSELTTSQYKTCIQPQLQIADDDLVTELPSMCDIPSEVQLPCASSPRLPPTLVNHLQPSNTGLLQLHVSVTNPSQLHLTVANSSQQCPANAGLSHIPVTCLPELQSPLESLSLQNGLEDNTSQLLLPGPSLMYTESEIPSSTLARLNVLIQPSFMDTDQLSCEVAARTAQQAQVQTIPPTKYSDASLSMIKSPTASQKTLKLPAGVSKTLKSATAYSAKTIPVNSIIGKAPTATTLLNSPAAIPQSMRSSAPNSAGVMSPADSQTLKSPSANPTLGKLPVAKQAVKKVSPAITSAQRLRTSSPSKQQSPQASPSKQKAPEVSLLLVKPPAANLSSLDPSMANLEISAAKQTLKYSKLRPPSVVHVKSRQTDSPDRSSTLVHQDTQKSPVKGATSNIPRMVTQKKDLHTCDGINPSRFSRLPKPKTQ